MAAVIQHASNSLSGADAAIFRNDTNNVTALQQARKQKLLMEEAARLQEEKLKSQVESTEKIKSERDALLADKSSLLKAAALKDAEISTLSGSKADLTGSLDQKSTEVAILTKEMATLTKDKGTLAEAKAYLGNEIALLRSVIHAAEKRGAETKTLSNSLPDFYQNATVQIINSSNAMAIDAGNGAHPLPPASSSPFSAYSLSETL